LRIGGGGRGPQSVVRVVGGRGENSQVILVGPELFCFPRVWEGFGVQLGVPEHFLEFPNPMPFFFFFFFYHAFIVSRYKKLRAALAMERTKPINQNNQQKKPYNPVHRVITEST